MVNYYELPQVSNSDLTALARACNALPDRRDELEDIFNFGSLVDAMLTESYKCRWDDMLLANDDATFTRYTPDVWAQAVSMVRQAKKDPVISLAIKKMIGQYVFVRRIGFTFEGVEDYIDMRCKFDQFSKAMCMGMEYKTTSCRTRNQFREAVAHFHWDRAAAVYMDLARIDQHWICGISKQTEEVFKIAVPRVSEIYQVGLKKYSFWCNRWNMLIPKFINHEADQLSGLYAQCDGSKLLF